MILNAVALTMITATISVFSRSLLNIIDRKTLGINKSSFAAFSLYNNIVPLFMLLIYAAIKQNHLEIISYFFLPETLFFAICIQCVGYAFGNAFRHMKIPKVIISSKLSDVFIPIAIYFVIGKWSWLDFLFSFITVLICMISFYKEFVIVEKKVAIATIFIIFSLFIQAACGSVSIQPGNLSFDKAISLTISLIAWRTIFTGLPFIYKKNISLNIFKMKENYFILISRGLLTVITQCSFILALSYGHPSLAWPIINSTALFSIIFSGFILGENASKREYMAITLIISCAIVRVFI